MQLSISGEYICTFRNCSNAAINIFGSSKNTENIRSCCDKKYGRKSVGGFMFVYENEYNKNKKYLYETDYYKNKKSVLQYDLDGNFIAEYESAREAERQTGIGYKMISRVAKGERPYTHGYVWKFNDIKLD